MRGRGTSGPWDQWGPWSFKLAKHLIEGTSMTAHDTEIICVCVSLTLCVCVHACIQYVSVCVSVYGVRMLACVSFEIVFASKCDCI